MVAECWGGHCELGCPNKWEMDEKAKILGLVEGFLLRSDVEDLRRWTFCINGSSP